MATMVQRWLQLAHMMLDEHPNSTGLRRRKELLEEAKLLIRQLDGRSDNDPQTFVVRLLIKDPKR